MLGNTYYHRSFIILKTMDKGFGLTDRKDPAGYCKMEIKRNRGTMQVYVQDMKPAETLQGTYTVLLVSTHEDTEPVEIASLDVGSGGRGEAEIVFDPKNVSGSGQPLDKYHALTVLFRPKSSGQEGVRLPLAGFSSQRSELSLSRKLLQRSVEVYAASKALPNAEADTEQRAVSAPIQEEADLEEDAKGAGEEASRLQTEALKEPETVPEIPEEVLQASDTAAEEVQAPDWEEELKALADQGERPKEPGAEAYPGLEEDYSPEIMFEEKVQGQGPSAPPAPSAQQEHYWDQVKAYYIKLFEGHKKVCPFEDAVGEVEWIRVAQRGDILYPYYPAPAYGYRPHYPSPDHYLIGLWRQNGRVRYVMYGVPGVYSAVPPMSTHGFSRWLPVKNGRGTGYWLLYIDGITGNIAYPY